MDDLTFVLWMESLDAAKVAATESFHCEAHRKWVELHQFEIARIKFGEDLIAKHDRRLAELADMWSSKDQRAETGQQRKTYSFTNQQLEIASQAEMEKS